MDIFKASREGDIEAVKEYINKGIDLNQKNEHGFTALHCAAMGSNQVEPEMILKVIKLLVEAGCSLEIEGNSKRTALYLLAEFSQSLEPIKYLVEKGANPNICDEYGNHIVKNAMLEEVQIYLSQLTGVPIFVPKPALPKAKIAPHIWKKVYSDLKKIFKSLSQKHIIALQDAGYTQSDAFDDCVEAFHKKRNKNEIIGFCFYTGQDKERAKNESLLPIGIWGAPNGEDEATITIGKLVVEKFEEQGYKSDWDGTASMRPTVLLHKYK